MAYLTSAPRAARASANCFTWCWACAKAIPYPGTIITRLAVANFATGSSSFFSFPSTEGLEVEDATPTLASPSMSFLRLSLASPRSNDTPFSLWYKGFSTPA